MIEFKGLYPHQQECEDACMDYLHGPSNKPSVVVAPTACHAKGYQVLMYDGSLKNVENITVGDTLMGNDSTKREVLKTHNGRGILYRITLRNKIQFDVNGDHVLYLIKSGNSKGYSDAAYPRVVEISVKSYLNWTKSRRHVYKILRTGVTFTDSKQLPVDPYYLGLWLGDGSSNNTSITTISEEVKEYLRGFADSQNLLYKESLKQGTKAVTVKLLKTEGKPNPLKDKLESIGVLNNKHIPHIYLTASKEDRLKLLSGLIDSDGYCDYFLNYSIILKPEIFSKHVYFLCNSLGFCPTIAIVKKSCTNCEDKSKRNYFMISFRGSEELSCIVERNKVKDKEYRTRKDLFTFTVEELSTGDYYGFTLDNNNLYVDENFIVQHNCGKSLIISSVAKKWDKPVLVLQPSKELLEQNIGKLRMMGRDAAIFSASIGEKNLDKFTYATLGSIKNHAKQLQLLGVETVMIDEAHFGYPPEPGSKPGVRPVVPPSMFMKFIQELQPKKVIGFTATPFLLRTNMEGSQLRMITRLRPGYFKEFIHITQIQELTSKGYWSKLEYNMHEFDDSGLVLNSSGSDFSDASVKNAIEVQNINKAICLRLKTLIGQGKRRILVFVDSLENARKMTDWAKTICNAEYLGSDLGAKERKRVVDGFKAGEVHVLINHRILSVGFDYPQLENIIFGYPTNSLAVMYQLVGRGVRVYPGKTHCTIDDFGGNVRRFGKVEDLVVENIEGWGWAITSNDVILTNVYMGGLKVTKSSQAKNSGKPTNYDGNIWFGKFSGTPIHELPLWYMKFILEKMDFASPQMQRLKKTMEKLIEDDKKIVI